MKNDGSDKLWYKFNKKSKVKYLNSHVTLCFSAMKKGVFLFAVRILLKVLSENKLLGFLNE
jgi:hypothetical protein